MTLTINLPADTIERIKAEAEASGKDIETFVREAVESKLARRSSTFAAALKPLRDAVAASGMSESDVEALIERELRSARAERRSATDDHD